MLIRRTLTRVPKCYNVQLCCVVLGLVPDSEMLVLLEQVGPSALAGGFLHGGDVGSGRRSGGTGEWKPRVCS